MSNTKNEYSVKEFIKYLKENKEWDSDWYWLKEELHHDHKIVVPIVIYPKGEENKTSTTYRWKENKDITNYLCSGITSKGLNLNQTVDVLWNLGYNKNSEVWRNIYRSIGYSLYGYWEVIHWHMNNEETDSYKPPVKDQTKLVAKLKKENKALKLEIERLNEWASKKGKL